jgi:hypothetical protein
MQPIIPFLRRFLFTLTHGAALMSYGVLTQRGRDRLKEVAAVFGYPRPRTALPRVTLEKLSPDPGPVELVGLARTRHNVNVFELMVLCRLAKWMKPHRIFEFGTYDGRTTLNLAVNTPPHTRILTLDLAPAGSHVPSGGIVGERYLGTSHAERIQQLVGNSLEFDFGPYEGTVDMVFIDAGHAYPSVLRDTQVAARLIRKEGGVIVWHDYRAIDGVTLCLDGMAARGGMWSSMCHLDETRLAILDTRKGADSPPGGSTSRSP